MTAGVPRERIRSAMPPPLVVLALALAAVTAYSYLGEAYLSATLLGIAAILSSLFFLLTRR
jgi:hypothetical protein